MRSKFKTLEDAEEMLDLNYSQDENYSQSSSTALNDPFETISSLFERLTMKQKIYIFEKNYLLEVNPNLTYEFIPDGFVELMAKALNTLFTKKKDNLFLYLAKCFGEFREDGNPRMPVDRMPFGLISHNLKFFGVKNAGTLKAPDDYSSWMQTMYSRFGLSWAALHLGPMWSFEDNSDIVTAALDKSGLREVLCKTNHVESTEETPKLLEDDDIVVKALNESGLGDIVFSDKSQESSMRKSYSMLWANITKAQKNEIEDADVTPRDIEIMYGLQPKRQRNVCVRDPLEVYIY